MIPERYVSADDDWQERARKYIYPKLHPYLRFVGAYSVSKVLEEQYVGYFVESEDVVEKELRDAGFRRNPISAFKTHPDGRESEGSWVLLHEDAPSLVESGMQLHVTLLRRKFGGRDVYAHYEDDWRVSPWSHLRAKNFSAPTGVSKAIAILDKHTFLKREEDDRKRGA